MSQKIELLNKVSIFKPLDNSVQKKLESIMEKRIVHEGEDIAVTGEKALFFFILFSGRVMLSMEEEKAVVLKDQGDFIGFELLSSKGVYKTTLKALTEGELFFLDRNKFFKMIQEDSSITDSIMNTWEAYLLKTAPFVEQLGLTGAEFIY